MPVFALLPEESYHRAGGVRLLRLCRQETHIIGFPFVKEIVEGKVVKETFRAIYAVAVLVVVGRVIGGSYNSVSPFCSIGAFLTFLYK